MLLKLLTCGIPVFDFVVVVVGILSMNQPEKNESWWCCCVVFTQLKDVSLAVCKGAFFLFFLFFFFPSLRQFFLSLQKLNSISSGLLLGVDVSFLIY